MDSNARVKGMFAMAALILLAACTGSLNNDQCKPGDTLCFEYVELILVCLEDGSGWTAEPCPEGTLCHDGSCQDLECVPGSSMCDGNAVITCEEDGSGWSDAAPCEEGRVCDEGECLEKICESGAVRCADERTVERCEGRGSQWQTLLTCPDGTSCFDGACLPDTCEPGRTECGPSTLYICNDEGVWEAHPCPDGQPCVFGACVECVDEANCAEGEACEDGVCVGTAPSITTRELPPATEGLVYSFALNAEGGVPPYSWTLVEGLLPGGMELAAEGVVRGTPSTKGTSTITVMVTDAGEATDRRAFDLEVFPAGPVIITTTALPNAAHGYDYSFPLAATGGTPPYAWQLLAGPLPPGMVLLSDGIITGVPDDVGAFPLTFRVLDAADPPGYDSKELGLFVEISPLVITGDPIYNLLLTKLVVLPVLIPYIPYRTTLEARGGLKPYTWSEQDPPDGIGWLVSAWGFPEGLSLEGSGAVSGWVTDVSDAQQIMIPFGPELTGYFIYIRVHDSQDPADSDVAIYCLPTVPLG